MKEQTISKCMHVLVCSCEQQTFLSAFRADKPTPKDRESRLERDAAEAEKAEEAQPKRDESN